MRVVVIDETRDKHLQDSQQSGSQDEKGGAAERGREPGNGTADEDEEQELVPDSDRGVGHLLQASTNPLAPKDADGW